MLFWNPARERKRITSSGVPPANTVTASSRCIFNALQEECRPLSTNKGARYIKLFFLLRQIQIFLHLLCFRDIEKIQINSVRRHEYFFFLNTKIVRELSGFITIGGDKLINFLKACLVIKCVFGESWIS